EAASYVRRGDADASGVEDEAQQFGELQNFDVEFNKLLKQFINEEARFDIALGIGNEPGADMLIQDGFEVVEIAIQHDPSRTLDAEGIGAGHLAIAEFL